MKNNLNMMLPIIGPRKAANAKDLATAERAIVSSSHSLQSPLATRRLAASRRLVSKRSCCSHQTKNHQKMAEIKLDQSAYVEFPRFFGQLGV